MLMQHFGVQAKSIMVFSEVAYALGDMLLLVGRHSHRLCVDDVSTNTWKGASVNLLVGIGCVTVTKTHAMKIK